jgi:DNA-binding response OmpR family regulator
LSIGRLRVVPAQRRVFVDDVPLELTPTEYALLVAFAREPNRVVSRNELLEEVFQTQHAGYARNVDCHVARLRRKLERAGLDPPPLGTVHGVGYVFAKDP